MRVVSQASERWAGKACSTTLASLLLSEPGTVVELRALGVGSRGGICSGYFNDPAALVAAVESLDGRASGIYVTLNPVQPELLARATNRLVNGAKHTTADANVLARRLLLIDVDPDRPSGISAAEAEREKASAVADEIAQYLASRGFPEPLQADSGNGYHLLYRVDLPADDGGLTKRVLEALAFQFDTDAVRIDQTVHNPARISKVYGTLARKGDNTPERPHRRSSILASPEILLAVPRDRLEELAARAVGARGVRPIGEFDLAGFIQRHGLAVARSGPWQGGRKFVLEACPFDPAHTDRSAYVVQLGNGALAAGCHHNGCAGKGCHDLRDSVEPGWRDRREASVSYVSGGVGASEDSWPEPQPLGEELPPVDPFHYGLLPASIHTWIQDIAERIQCPPDFPAVAAMVALAGVMGRRVGIRPKRHDDWLVVPNLWGAIVGRPGVLKTPAIQEPLKPLKRLEIEAKKEFDETQQRYDAELMVAEARKKTSNKSIIAALTKGGDALGIAEEVVRARPEKPRRRRYLINDSTVEKLGEILNENPSGVTCYRDELVGLLWALDKEGQEGARAFFLEAWNGAGRYTYDRIGRGTIDIEAAVVSIIGGIQPGPLRGYLHHAVAATQQDDGLMQRFQLAVWPDCSSTWINVDRWPDSDARRAAFEVFERLDRLTPASIGATRDELEPDGIPFLHFSANAQDLFDSWRADLERRVRSGQEHPAIESHLAKYRSLIPSLALLIHLAEDGCGPVGEEALTKAMRWGPYLESHARRLYSVATDLDLPAARALSAKVLSGALSDGFALRDVYRPCWTGLAGRDEADRAAKVLIDLDWLHEVKEKTAGAPRTTYRINPRIREMAGEGTDKTDRGPAPPTLGSLVSAPPEPSRNADGPDDAEEWEVVP